MKHLFHPEAEQEFLDAIDYDESNEPGLGEDFHAQIMATVGRIAQNPTVWPFLDGDVRRCLVHRFPFGVLDSIEADAIFILAVMHLRRHPDYWKGRLG